MRAGGRVGSGGGGGHGFGVVVWQGTVSCVGCVVLDRVCVIVCAVWSFTLGRVCVWRGRARTVPHASMHAQLRGSPIQLDADPTAPQFVWPPRTLHPSASDLSSAGSSYGGSPVMKTLLSPICFSYSCSTFFAAFSDFFA